jgi:UDP-N-acetylmuramoyl-tripeptide--D-alanyl-D-alanine ligase
MLQSIVLKILELQARRFLKKHKPKLVVFTGSVGKTSTKLYTATVLSQKFQVMVHYGNHNTHFSVPLAIANIPYPTMVHNPLAWLKVFVQMETSIHQAFNYDVILLELGTDHPGEIPHFGSYLRPDIGVITSITEEHMEFFKTIDAVAKEELSTSDFSELTLINRDDIDAVFAKLITTSNIDTYGTSGVAEYHYLTENFDVKTGFQGKFVTPEWGEQAVPLHLVGEHNIKAAVAAGTIAIKLGLDKAQVIAGMQAIQPVKGRMQLLRGLRDTTLLDDTYNSSPKAALAALQTLYLLPAKQRIAILGSMNELGDFSEKAHKQVGFACDPTLLDWVITVGDQAEKYLAPAATSKGCMVRSFKSPYDAGAFAHSVMQPGAVILAKGSQNKIFTEEALKVLLHTTSEEKQLVRQEPEWLAIKQEQFGKFPDLQKSSSTMLKK